MKTRPLGKSGIQVSEISFGCWTMGGLNWSNGSAIGWANVDEDEVTRAVRIALDAGVNHFDNADVYGNGRAERMLRRVFDRLGVKSESVIIATKVGHFAGTAEHAYEPAHIRHQCEQSLINLGRDTIDLYYFHHGNFGDHLESAAETMHALVKEGKVRFVGQSANSAEDFARSVTVVRPTVLQARAHALFDTFIREGSALQNLMAEHGLSLVAFSPLAQGLLLDKFDPSKPPKFEDGDFRQGRREFEAENLEHLRPRLAKLKERFGGTTEDLATVALQFVLSHTNVCCVIPGFRNERQAMCNLAGAERTLSAEDVQFIRDTLHPDS